MGDQVEAQQAARGHGYREYASYIGHTIDPGGASGKVDIKELFYILRRRRWLLFMIITMFVIGAIGFISTQEDKFRAEAVVQINTRNMNVVDIEAVMQGISSDESAVKSEVDILTSRYLVGRVVDRLNLIEDPEFNELLRPKGIKEKVEDYIYSILPLPKHAEKEVSKQEQVRIARTGVIDNVLKELEVRNKYRSYTIVIDFTSKSAKKSADIANTLVDEYLNDQLEIKFQATKKANEWLNKRLEELRNKVRISEQRVQLFREKYDLTESKDGDTVADQQLSELNSQLIMARTEYALAEAKLDNIKKIVNDGGDVESAAEVLNSLLIQKLREQEASVLRKEGELATRYGARHPKMINVRAELRDLRNKIQSEISKIVSNLENEVEIAKLRQNTLEDSLAGLKKTVDKSGRAGVQLSELMRQAQANRTLYESFLTRFKETSGSQDLEQSDARMISAAEPPIERSWPKNATILFLAVAIGTIFGLIVIAIIEHFDNGFKNAGHLERITAMHAIGMIPTFRTRRKQRDVDHIVENVTGAFAESIRSVRTAVHFSNPDNPPQVMMVTSSVPNEGKSMFSLSFARQMAKSGQKVLLVDADLRRPSIAKMMELEGDLVGLEGLLTNSEESEQGGKKNPMWVDPDTGLYILASSNSTTSSQELLGAKKMKALVEKWRTEFDYIVFDTPPVMALSDALTLSTLCDTSLFMVRWDETPREVVLTALKKIRAVDMKIAGLVMTRVNVDKHSKYGGYADQAYYYGKYKEYYS